MAIGSLTLIIGPMFAGKSTELMRRVKREIHARKSCFVVKYGADQRYSKEHMATHDRLTFRVDASVSKLDELGKEWKAFDVIAIDEGQFFPDIVEFCATAADCGKTVFVSALDGDFKRKPFGKICDLIPHCNEIVKLTAVCMLCHSEDACFTRRTVQSDETELIGGAEAYIATCRDCYLNPEMPTPRKLRRMNDTFRLIDEASGKEAMVCAATPAPKEAEEDESPAAKKQRLDVSPP